MCNLRIRSAKKWVGRSDVSDSKDRRAARGRGSVGRTFPTHFFPRCARHGVGRSDWLRFSPRCERYRVGIERPSAQSVLRGPGERRARNRPRVRTTLIGSRGSKRPLKVYKSDVPEENLTFGLFLRSWKVEESKDRNPSFHLLYKRPRLVIVETNAGSRKFGEDHEAFVCAPACTICGSIVTRHYAFTLCVACE